MRARKVRYDESFVEPNPAPETAEVTLVGSGDAAFVPSPARQLQEQLQGRLSESEAVATEEKFSPRTNLLIIAGSCVVLWTMIVAAGFLISLL